ncbi:MAG: maltose alpha-D-glucosyltransferase [Chthoniobacterales bacterium]
MSNPLWFKEAVVYELHIKTFQDGNGDGIGDFPGLLSRLDYLQELGVTAIWVLPFYPSPLRDDGYDIADYYSVNPSYGTLEDFQTFLQEAHARGLRVITELVLNHTSDQNVWFQHSRRAPAGSPEREFYVWSDTPDRYAEARIIFKDFEASNWTWDAVAKSYFWHRFYSHQPDLNFDNPAVHEELFRVIDFWLAMGVDGLRLDAVPYLYEREGTNCENLPETHAFLQKLRAHIDAKFEDRMLLAEANQWPEDAAKYFGQGDECQMEFHFPLMPRMFMSIQMEDRFPIIDIMEQTPAIPESCQWAIFLRNHDELTLEMVTDEERDYMYRVYALDARARINLGIRRRLAPLLGNNRRKIELINSLLLSLPGTPILYYGDEIGMGDNFYLGDRNGVRTPMQWSADRNAGFSSANPQQLYLPVVIDPGYHYESVNVENQLTNPSSLLWWMRRLLRVRQQSPAFSSGSLEFLHPDNAAVLAYIRRLGDDTILCLANLSRFSQAIELDLAAFAGCVPYEMFGNTAFPTIKETPMVFTLAPHGFYWLSLKNPVEKALQTPDWIPPLLTGLPAWNSTLQTRLEKNILAAWMPTCRWFGGKGRVIRDLHVIHNIQLDAGTETVHVLAIEVTYADGNPDTWLLPLAIATAEIAAQLASLPVLAKWESGAVLCDALWLPSFRSELLNIILQGGKHGLGSTQLIGLPGGNMTTSPGTLPSRLLGGEQSNTTIVYGDQWFLKFLRQFENGSHPDLEVTRYLTTDAGFTHSAPYAGALVLRSGRNQHGLIALLVEYTRNQGDGWAYALEAAGRFFERVLAASGPNVGPAEMVGAIFPERMQQLGQRTAELHIALANRTDLPDFAPEEFSTLWQRSLYQALRGSTGRLLRQLRRQMSILPDELQFRAARLLQDHSTILKAYAPLMDHRIKAVKTRVHGDYHLGQVLNTGKDFVIIDFGGEPRKTLGERNLKRSPLVDVAGMLRSFDYAACVTLRQEHEVDQSTLAPWAELWVKTISESFLTGYFAAARPAGLIPESEADTALLLRIFLLDKAIYEVGYELSYRPSFVEIPLRAVEALLAEAAGQTTATP